jgi:rod shape determining protein RodA
MQARLWRHFDGFMLMTTLLLLAFGAAMLFSATGGLVAREFPQDTLYRQFLYAGIGLLFMVGAAAADYRVWQMFAWPLYGLALLGLAAVLVIGFSANGAQRWIQLPGFQLQPSEFAKVLVVVALARFLARKVDDETEEEAETHLSFRDLLISLALVLLPAALVYRQPDLGTALIFLVAWAGMVIAAGASWRHLVLLAVCGAASAPFLLLSSHSYMRERIEIFLDPHKDPFGAGYNVIQAQISVGSGGISGLGFNQGTQSQLDFLRVKYTDFIFSVIGEELGFVGALLLLALFFALIIRCLRVADMARDPFGRLTAIGLSTTLLCQVFANVGMNISLIPAVGVPLPLISAGGSSLIAVLLSIGILQSTVMRHKRLEF